MKNHGWTRVYADRAIGEYKKFAFLTVVAPHQIVPSDAVDQVWHAHILLTQSYWHEFCPQVLGKPLHHHPARGGQQEHAEFHQLYDRTISSYRRYFGEPPTDIWSPPDIRFGSELTLQRINRSQYWLIPKCLPPMHWIHWHIMLLGISLPFSWVTAVQASETTTIGVNLNPDHVPLFYLAAIPLGLLIRYLIRYPKQQPRKPQLDLYETAYLAGGTSRATELAIARLVAEGYLLPIVASRTFTVIKPLSANAHPLEKQVMQQSQYTPQFKNLRQGGRYDTSSLRGNLERQKILLSGWKAFIGKSFGYYLVFSVLGPLAWMTWMSLLNIQPPDLNFSPWLYLALGLLTFCCIVPQGHTHWGSRVLTDLKKNHDAFDVLQRIALLGYTALSGGRLDALKQIYQAQLEEEAANAAGCGC
ncbi:MAG TPA: TIGR04222 domain-containing membrane protein [Leptolyngbyaceae cyanobacterium M33_DOE_097]|uniref:TIGR04222 domain-containing membrane protein n=1 Tax=Oscillatoriales cyanobacterium SpSt-418 TaxID=2282169 RepID=A0A7C3KGR5_9CYAN|nr:TIGR04222 domain-containing membrane protein [Leptolyngbyaceae cyanobacterium M33_DOE_097]